MRFKLSLSRSSLSHWASYYSIAPRQIRGLLLRNVAMSSLYLVPLLRQSLLHFLSDKDRPVLPARTSKRHCQVALSFFDVVGQQEFQKLFSFIQKLLRLWKLQHILRNVWVFSGQLAKLRHKMGIRQKAHVEYQIRLCGHTI